MLGYLFKKLDMCPKETITPQYQIRLFNEKGKTTVYIYFGG